MRTEVFGKHTPHRMTPRVLYERQITPRIRLPFGYNRHEGIDQQRVNFTPVRQTIEFSGDDHIQTAHLKPIQKAMRWPGLKREPRVGQPVRHGCDQHGRHIGLKILNHPQTQLRQLADIQTGKL